MHVLKFSEKIYCWHILMCGKHVCFFAKSLARNLKMLKTVVLLNLNVETWCIYLIRFIFQKGSKEQHSFKIEIIIMSLLVTFAQSSLQRNLADPKLERSCLLCTKRCLSVHSFKGLIMEGNRQNEMLYQLRTASYLQLGLCYEGCDVKCCHGNSRTSCTLNF